MKSQANKGVFYGTTKMAKWRRKIGTSERILRGIAGVPQHLACGGKKAFTPSQCGLARKQLPDA